MNVPQMFALFLEDRIYRNLSPKTILFYEDTTVKFVKWLGDRPLTKQVIQEYANKIRERNLTSKTVQAHVRAIKAFLNYSAEEGMIEPIKLRLPKVDQQSPRVLSIKEINRLRQACHANTYLAKNTRDEAVILFLFDTGVRRSELVNLTWDDIEFSDDGGRVYVNRGKGGKSRTVFFGQETKTVLERLRKHGERQSHLSCLIVS